MVPFPLSPGRGVLQIVHLVDVWSLRCTGINFTFVALN